MRTLRVRSLFAFLLSFTIALSGAMPARAGGSGGLTVTTASHVDQGTNYNNYQLLLGAGGTAPYSFTNISDSKLISGGVVFHSDGTVSGLTCGNNGNDVITGTVTDNTGATASFSTSTTINTAPSGTCNLTITVTGLPAGASGAAYNGSVTASGGSCSSFTYSISSGSLPPGLSLNGSTGAITGTPTSTGSYTFFVTAICASGNGAVSASITINTATLAITTATLPTPVITQAYNQTIGTINGAAPVTFSVSAGALPAGLSLNASTGAITGTPTTAGAYNFTVQAKDNGGKTATQAYTGTIVPRLAIATATLPTPLISQAYSQTVTTSGGTAPVTFSVSAGTLPAGLSLNASNGAITGTPNAAGAYNFTIQAKDANSVTAAQAYSGTIASALSITTATLPVPLISQAYTQTVATNGGTAPIAFSVSAGALPAGLSLNTSTGSISGTPTAPGNYNFTIQAKDANNVTASQAYTGTIVSALAITTATLPAPIVNVAYSQTVATSGGTAPVTFTISAGSLPGGLSLNASTGIISGTATVSGAYSFTVQVEDANNVTASQAYSGTIAVAGSLQITTLSLPAPLIDQTYTQSIATSGGVAPIAFAVTSGAIPHGLSFNTGTGAITGTADTAGAYGFTITATDSTGGTPLTASQAYSGTIVSALAIATASLPVPLIGQSYGETVSTSGGTSPVTFSISTGALPHGLSLDPASGAISGTPDTAGTYTFTVQAKDANNVTAAKTYTGTIAAAFSIATATVSTPLIGQSYTQTINTSGGTSPITFAVTSGALPGGLTLHTNTGIIDGTAAAAGAYSFTVTATDANGVTDAKAYTVTIAAALTITTASLPVPLIAQAYNHAVNTSGGTGSIAFTISAGTLPTGLSLDPATGVISGTPAAAGAYDYTVKATDANNVFDTKEYTGTIAAAIAITTASIPAPLIDQPYNQTIATSGGTAPVGFSVVLGSLPAGLSLDPSTGVLSGTPTAPGTYSFTVQATDTNGVAATQAYSGTIVSALAIATATIPTPVLSHSYNQNIATSGGTAPIAFGISAGALPTGMSLDPATGIISGTPAASGAYTFTVQAKDANNVIATQAYSGTIAGAVAITTATLPVPTIGQSYSQSVVATGGTAPIAFTVSAGTLPHNLSLDSATGAITGTPDTTGAYDFTIKASDANNLFDTKEYTGTIVAALSIATATLPVPLIGQSYDQTVQTAGGTAPIGFSISAGALPAGLSLNLATGEIAGTPAAAGAYTFTVQAKDANNVKATQTYSGTIVAAISITTATLPAPLLGHAYNQTVNTSGGTSPVSFTISAGTLPHNLSISSSTGAIAGTPDTAGAYDFTIKATDTNNVSDTKEYTGTIVPAIAITTATLPVPLVNQPYSHTVNTTGGTAPIGFSLSAGALPHNLGLDPLSGAITGTPDTTGAYDFTVKANDANSIFDTKEYTGTIVSAIAITTATLPVPLIDQAYNQNVATTGGTSPIAFNISAGALPAGLNLNAATGAISGTPSATGSYDFTVKANDANNVFDTKEYTGTILSAIAITTTSLPAPLINQSYDQTVQTTGGTAPTGFSISAGSLPAGLSLNTSTGEITGTPTAAGAYTFTVQAKDANNVKAVQAYSGTIVAVIAITTATLPMPLINQAYSHFVATTGGTAPVAFGITSGSLPHGLTLNASTGAISGTADTAGAYTFTVTATDANHVTDSKTYTGTIAAAIAITTATLPVPLIGHTYSQSVQTSGGTAPVAFSISAGALPAGLSLNPGTGAIAGLPSATGSYSFTVKAADANTVFDTKTYTGTIVAQIAITTASLSAMEVNQAFSQTIDTSGGTLPLAFSVTAGTLPAGLSLNSASGAITGTPAIAGGYSVTISAADANSITAVKTYTGSILAPLAITTPSLPNPVLNLPYSQTVQTGGGLAPVTFAVSAGALPSGLTLNPNTGVISGTATAPATFSFTITATDANGSTASKAYNGAIAAQLAITTLTLPVPLIGQPYNQTVHTSGGSAPVSFSIQTGTLPPGLTLNPSTGAISGTPANAGAYSFTVYASDANGMIATEPYSGTIVPALAITTPSLPVPLVNAPYNQTVHTSGGTAPVAFTISGGALPAGLTLNPSTGVITGTPSAPGTYAFTVTATDANNVTSAQTYNGTIVPALAILTAMLPAPFIGVAYSQSVQTSGGTAPVAFAVTAGVLPAGLTVNASTGVVTGTAVNAGPYSFAITATDANGVSASKTYTGTIAAAIAITTASLPIPLTGHPYNQTVQTSGGTAPVTCAVTSGALPAGLSLDSSTCAISGTPSGSGSYSFTVTATDANGVTASQTYSGTIAAVLAIATLTLPVPLISQAYSQTVATTGGTAPVSFGITSGSLPYGLTLNAATGTISGTPVTAGAYTFTVTATDANAIAASKTYTGTIVTALAITTATLPVPALTQAYNQTIRTSGGTAPVTFAVTGGALPAGLALSTAGAVTGTPAASGAYSFNVTATDTNNVTATKTYSGTIAAALSITTATLPVPVINTAYWQRVQTSGGISPVTFAVSGGTLPSGLSIESITGIISGIPNVSGAYTFTITATDSIGTTATKTYSGTIAAPLTIVTPAIPVPEVGAPYSQTVNTTGGVGPFTFAVSGGTLPPGLTLDPHTGVISGTLTSAGSYSFTVSVTDANGTVKTVTYSGNVAAALSITTLTLAVPVINTAYDQHVETGGGVSPVTFALSGGSLPAGLSLNAGTGAITGTPSASGAYTFTVEATDSTGSNATHTYAGTIAAPLAIVTPTIPVPEVGAPYSQTVSTTGGAGPFTFAVTGGTLPAGLTLDPHTGVISGTLATAGPYSFTVSVTDANGTVRTVTYSGNVTAALSITTLTLPAPSIDVAYLQTVATSGGTAPIAFGITGGSLPAGLSLNSASGAITGTPSAAGSYSFTVTATDTNAATAARTYTGTILPPVVITTPSLPVPEAGQPYHETVQTTGGTGPFRFAVTSGSLPAGLTLDPSTGAIAGTLTSSGAYSFTVTVTDANGNTSSVTYSGTVAAAVALTTASITVPSINTAYSQTLQTTGGTAPVTFAVTAGVLPAGLTLNAAAGVITGTPSAPGAYSFTVTATDANGGTSSQTYSGTIAPPVAITTPALPVPEQGQPYNQTVQTNGGVAPFTFAVTGGSLPAGLQLDPATGVISGTLTGSGTYSFTVTVTDAHGTTSSQTYTGTVNAPLAITTTSIPVPPVGSPYAQTVQTTGGVAPLTFALSGGSLPPGLTLDPNTGVISGTLSAPGPYSFTVEVTDSLGVHRYVTFAGVVRAAVAVSPASLPAGMVGIPYTATVTATGGQGPYQLSIVSGALPAGLTFDASTGVISGKPSAAGTATFTLQAKDSLGSTGTAAYSLQIAARPDPSQNVGVRGLIAAQTSAMSRFASAQTENITRHMEQQHDGARCASNDLQLVNTDQNKQNASAALPLGKSCSNGGISAWTAGSLLFGSAGGTNSSMLNFHTDGVTAGADARLSKNFLVGLAVGSGFDQTAIGANDGSLRSGSTNAALYASFQPAKNLFLDALAGQNNATFDGSRFDDNSSSFMTSHRTATGTFESIVAGLEYRNGRFEYSPYVRADSLSSRFGSASDEGTSPWSLSYASMNTSNTTFIAGVRGSIDLKTSFGTVTPLARIEVRDLSLGSQSQSLQYKDGFGPSYSMFTPATAQSGLSGSFGLRVSPNEHFVFQVDYDFEYVNGILGTHTVRPELNLRF